MSVIVALMLNWCLIDREQIEVYKWIFYPTFLISIVWSFFYFFLHRWVKFVKIIPRDEIWGWNVSIVHWALLSYSVLNTCDFCHVSSVTNVLYHTVVVRKDRYIHILNHVGWLQQPSSNDMPGFLNPCPRVFHTLSHLKLRLLASTRHQTGLFLQLNHLLFLLLINRWQMILYHLILPVIYGSIPLFFILCVILIFDIHSCIVLVITNFKFTKLLCESRLIWLFVIVKSCLCGVVLLHHLCLLSLNEVVNCCLLFYPCLLLF